MDRVILHIDMNNFYASVETLYDPSLRDVPMAVGGDRERRHGIVLAKNMLAKAKGVKTAEALWEAERKCPGIRFVPPHFDRYAKYSRLAKSIYAQYTDMVESFGLDECWLDVTGSTRLFGSGREIAEEIRLRIREELGLTVSVGVSFNKIFAKLGSDYRKPDAVTEITRENFREIVWPLDAGALLFVGKSTQAALRKYGMRTIGDVAQADRRLLRRLLGKNGEQLNIYANGEDMAPVARIGEAEELKSVSNSTTAIHDLRDDGEIRAELYMLSESVAHRLREKGLSGYNVQLSVRKYNLETYQRQKMLDVAVADSESIFRAAYGLFRAHHTGGVDPQHRRARLVARAARHDAVLAVRRRRPRPADAEARNGGRFPALQVRRRRGRARHPAHAQRPVRNRGRAAPHAHREPVQGRGGVGRGRRWTRWKSCGS